MIPGEAQAVLAELRAALRVTQPEAVVDDGWNAMLGQLSQRPAEALAAMRRYRLYRDQGQSRSR